MKSKILLGFTAISLCVQCFAQKKKAAYEFPDAMAKPIQAEFAKQCEKGLILYQINCARCHNTGTGKKSLIPDFTPDQLVGYELRVLNPKHESEIPETTVSAEELGQIMTFLAYKTKSGIVMQKSAVTKPVKEP